MNFAPESLQCGCLVQNKTVFSFRIADFTNYIDITVFKIIFSFFMFSIKGDQNIICIDLCEIMHFLCIFVRFLTFPDIGTPTSSELNYEILNKIFLKKIPLRDLRIHYIFILTNFLLQRKDNA